MGDIFKLEIRLDGQSMTEFGGYVSEICCVFPELVLVEVRALKESFSASEPDLPAIRERLSRLEQNAGIAVRIGNGIATIIGRQTPERIDGGPVQ